TKTGERIMSSYHFCDDKIWIITERDRSVTTVLLPSEY
ncbi:type I restriction endonuclease subunit M, partial [Vibrio splendidus]